MLQRLPLRLRLLGKLPSTSLSFGLALSQASTHTFRPQRTRPSISTGRSLFLDQLRPLRSLACQTCVAPVPGSRTQRPPSLPLIHLVAGCPAPLPPRSGAVPSPCPSGVFSVAPRPSALPRPHVPTMPARGPHGYGTPA